jgi:hypothetical protein
LPWRSARDLRTARAAIGAAVGLILHLGLAGPGIAAQPSPPSPPGGDRLRLAYTPRVFHVTNDPDYVDWNHVVALEWLTPRYRFWGADRSHFGVALFDNSYGQPSQSLYAGLEWDWTRALGGEVFVAVSVGLVHGYKEPYEDKLPLNSALGVGLTLVPAIGWQRGAFGWAASLSGSAIALRVSLSFAP